MSVDTKNNTLKIHRYFTVDCAGDVRGTVEWGLMDIEIKDVAGEMVFEQKGVECPNNWSVTAVTIAAQKYFRGHDEERESSIWALVDRIASSIAEAGVEHRYFYADDRQVLREELQYLLLHQMMAFNSPVWFNVGTVKDPQSSACYILDVQDDMESILNWITEEGLVFRKGSGAGVNLSKIREKNARLKGGGHASGPMSFAAAADRSAAAIKSGGKTRRAAKILIMDVDHPDIEEFIEAKVEGEKVAKALIAAGFDPAFNVDDGAYALSPWQNANNSVRVTDDFMRAVREDTDWDLKSRVDGSVTKTVKARDLFKKISQAAWECGDPGIQFHDTINDWHTCKVDGEIIASNPCQPDFATVLTPDGIKTFADVDVGSVIWSGKQWTKIKRKIATGTKNVYRYQTKAGFFVGTDDHRIVERGVKIPVKDATAIDASQGPAVSLDEINDTDVIDGFVLCRSENTSNENDGMSQTYVNPYQWEMDTTLKSEDLTGIQDRRVPDRFKYGSHAVRRGFLRGAYTSGGYVNEGPISFKSESFNLVSDVQEMLSSIGIQSYLGTVWDSTYTLHITHDRPKFLEMVGFLNPFMEKVAIENCKEFTSVQSYSDCPIQSIVSLGEMPVWDIEVEADEHTYWTGGVLVSNCSEYMFLTDTSCNLASMNLQKYCETRGGKRSFQIDKFARAVQYTILAQEILVSMSSYPTEKITKGSKKYRTLGIGVANLGAMIMSFGLAYDSPKARSMAGAVMSLLSSVGYSLSSDIAKVKGSFRGFFANKGSFISILRRHLKEARNQGESSHADAFKKVFAESQKYWTHAVYQADEYGIRNAQISVAAPTGTISLIMDCDTTGIEPDLALVKYKKLVGGGTLKIVNSSVRLALKTLGYSDDEIRLIEDYIQSNDTIEGAPGLKDQHLPVFDCALKPPNGTRYIAPLGHIRMMASCQPFLSGAISKTVNVPNEYTADDISSLYLDAWGMGLKSVAVYRDGCKQSQPMNISDTESKDAPTELVKPSRDKMPDDRMACVHKFNIQGHDGYLTLGYYPDGRLGEVFVNMSKQGSTLSGLMDAWATMISLGIQYGIPLSTMVDKFRHTSFEPSGFTTNPQIRSASSIIDYVAQMISLRSQVPVDGGPVPSTSDTGDMEKNAEDIVVSGPPCAECGHMTVRAGACYKCDNCGSTTGCG